MFMTNIMFTQLLNLSATINDGPSHSTFKLHVLVTQPIFNASELFQVEFLALLLFSYYVRCFFLIVFIFMPILINICIAKIHFSQNCVISNC